MLFLEFFSLAIKNLSRHKLRSFLTTLGIIFGIGAVVSMMSVGSGAHSEILEQIKKMGTTNIIINTIKPPEDTKAASSNENSYVNNYGLTFQDSSYFETILKSAESIMQIHRIREEVYYKNKVLEPKILGVPHNYFSTMNLNTRYGRSLNIADYEQRRKVCVVGEGILRELAYIGDPLDLYVRLGKNIFRVIGVSGEQNANKILAEGESLNIYIPFTTSVTHYGTLSIKEKTGSFEITQVELEQIIITCKHVEDVIDTALVVSSVLKNFHSKRDYEVVVPLQQLQQVQKTQRIFQIVMVLIAGISLLVGGIGIANIMFANVTERTREIGIRRALGAKKKDIMLQFLCETILIAIIGGILGCALGILGTYSIQQFTGWQATLDISSMLTTLFISCIVGVLSGIAPAHYAAKGKPIESLRRE